MNLYLSAKRGRHGRYHLILVNGGNHELVLFGQPWKRRNQLFEYGRELAGEIGVPWIEPDTKRKTR